MCPLIHLTFLHLGLAETKLFLDLLDPLLPKDMNEKIFHSGLKFWMLNNDDKLKGLFKVTFCQNGHFDFSSQSVIVVSMNLSEPS